MIAHAKEGSFEELPVYERWVYDLDLVERDLSRDAAHGVFVGAV